MRAVLCKRLGLSDALVVESVPVPHPGPGHVLVRVKAVGLNFFDTLIIEGKYQVKPPLPFSPGGEFAGQVEACGPGVAGFAPGVRVLAYCGHGAARELILVDAAHLVLIPAGLDEAHAACLPIAYGTTLHALADRAKLQPGETVAVLGAAGGVGQAAVEIAKLLGARVIACASSDDKLEFCKSLGADALVNYETTDLKQALREATGGHGVDVIYDPVGGALAEPALRAIAWSGRYLVIGFASGAIPKLPLNLVLLKGCDLLGVYWGAHVERAPERHRANLRQLADWAAAGKLRPHIHKTYRLEDTPEALRAIANREVKGKAVIVL